MTAGAGTSIALEWGPVGYAELRARVSAVVIVDVLSFTTCVAVAVERDVVVLPFAGAEAEAPAFARAHDARLAARRGQPGPSLSPPSLAALNAGERLVLPSPNGSRISDAAADARHATFAGCLRNATAVARAVQAAGSGGIAVIAAGERWPDGSLRPCLEDWLGAGAIVAALLGERSPEAAAAEASFRALAGSGVEVARAALARALVTSPSGRELRARGYGEDVLFAAQLDATASVPTLCDGAYRRA